MNFKDQILELSRKYSDQTVENLSQMIKIPSYSGHEREICTKIIELCKANDFDEVWVDGFGSVVGRIGKGKKKLAFDAHIDTVEIGDETQWKVQPFSGERRNGLVYGLGASDQLGGASSMITAGRILKDLEYGGDYSCYFTFTVMEED
ncbi:MAG: M20/M25/M40 family metallo-hydrolase, partial [Synergistales bacterium]|nr:M20/M25/M40 family metallo-hydrolase [Synergistales bacterium]